MTQPHDFLQTIVPIKEEEVRGLRKRKNPFEALFESAENKPILIAEIKPKSPSGGELFKGDAVELALTYQASGADAISVLTDEKFFGGSTELLQKIRQAVSIPLLRKDFIIDEAQLLETVNRADAVLLIVSILTEEMLIQLIVTAYRLGLVPVVEVASKEELATAVKSGAKIIGVNARNLRNPVDVNLDRAFEVLDAVPKSVIGLFFSGIEGPEDVGRAIEHGARGVLVGASLLKAGDMESISQKVKELKNI